MAVMRFVIVKVHANSDYGRESLRWTDVPIFNVSVREFHFTYFFLTGSPGFIRLLVSSRLPCQLIIPIYIPVL